MEPYHVLISSNKSKTCKSCKCLISLMQVNNSKYFKTNRDVVECHVGVKTKYTNTTIESS